MRRRSSGVSVGLSRNTNPFALVTIAPFLEHLPQSLTHAMRIPGEHRTRHADHSPSERCRGVVLFTVAGVSEGASVSPSVPDATFTFHSDLDRRPSEVKPPIPKPRCRKTPTQASARPPNLHGRKPVLLHRLWHSMRTDGKQKQRLERALWFRYRCECRCGAHRRLTPLP